MKCPFCGEDQGQGRRLARERRGRCDPPPPRVPRLRPPLHVVRADRGDPVPRGQEGRTARGLRPRQADGRAAPGRARSARSRPRRWTRSSTRSSSSCRTVPTARSRRASIGERVMERLRELDKVAYVRFASVYRQFEDVRGVHGRAARSARRRASEPPARKGPSMTRRRLGPLARGRADPERDQPPVRQPARPRAARARRAGAWIPNADILETDGQPDRHGRAARASTPAKLSLSRPRRQRHRHGARRPRPTVAAGAEFHVAERALRPIPAGDPARRAGQHPTGRGRARSNGLLRIRFPKVPNRRGEAVPIEVRVRDERRERRAQDGTSRSRSRSELPVLPLRDMVVYPFIIAPLSVARDMSIQAVDEALAENRMILLVAQRDKDEEEPAAEDLFRRRHRRRDHAHAQAARRADPRAGPGRVPRAGRRVHVAGRPYLAGADRADRRRSAYDPTSIEKEALMRSVKQRSSARRAWARTCRPRCMVIADNLEDPGRLADLTASNLELKVERGAGGPRDRSIRSRG